MRVGTWNILSGQTPLGVNGVSLRDAIASLDLDVLGLNEVDHNRARSGYVEQELLAADALDAADWRFAPSYAGPDNARRALPGLLLGPRDRAPGSLYGIALLSRIPVRQWHRLDLGRSAIGLPLLDARGGRRRIAYVEDELHSAIAAELSNGWTAIATHLSFVTHTAVTQLLRVRRWARRFGPRVVILGDMNLPRWTMPRRAKWVSIVDRSTYPAWRPTVQFDHILVPQSATTRTLHLPASPISDHVPIAVEIAG